MPIKNHTPESLRCKCGCGLEPPQSSVDRLNDLQALLGRQLVVNSAVRCAAHNAKVGGSAGSAHLPAELRKPADRIKWGGCGFDIAIKDKNEAAVIEKAALQCGFRGFGSANTFIHIDDAQRPSVMYWKY